MTLLIKNVQPLGAAKQFGDRIDIFISGEYISAIGSFPGKRADTVIEGQGIYVSPGFINVNAESDHDLSLFHDPHQEQFLNRGVTTIIGGQSGISLAPLLYGELEALEERVCGKLVNVNWHTMEEFAAVMARRRLGVNFGTLIGHHTVRRAIGGEEARDLTRNELAVLRRVITEAVREGGWGLSTSLDSAHGRGTPYHEIKQLLQAIEKERALYATSVRRGGEMLNAAVAEVIRLTKETAVKTIMTDFAPQKGEEKRYRESLAFMAQLSADFPLFFEVPLEDVRRMPLSHFLPSWAQAPGRAAMLKNIKDPWMRERIRKDMPAIKPEEITVERAENKNLPGRTLKDFMELYALKNAKEGLLRLMEVTALKAFIAHRVVATDLLPEAFRHSRALIGGDILGFISRVFGDGIMTLEEAIGKITASPARVMGIEKRGMLKEGWFADLVGFAVREGPLREKQIEIKFAVVNGRVAMKDGQVGDLSGHLLLRNIHHAG